MADLEKQVPINTKPIKINDPLPPKRCRNCCRSCLSILLKIIITIIILIGVPIALFFIIVNPQKMKVTITEATLKQFRLAGANNTNFIYDLDLNLTIRNPNRIMGFYYQSLDSWLYYANPVEIAREWSSGDFYQGKKNTAIRSLSFKRNRTLADGFDDAIISQFNREKSSGVSSIDVKMEYWVKVKLGKIKIGTFIPRIDCELKVPLSNGKRNATTTFKATKCDVVFKATSIFDRGFEACKSCN
ncbi:hypothetical protein UlMin_005425 [Ulmus minor]